MTMIKLAYITLICSFISLLYGVEKPNIILILSDDQGINDLSCYGSEIPTPHIDSIARDGVQLQNFYVAAPICTPSRFGLLTGQHPSRSQDQLLGALMFLDPEHAKIGIRQHETTIATQLRGNGYTTALLGKWHLGHGSAPFMPTSHGFDLFKGHTAGCVDFYTMRYGNTIDWYHNLDEVDVTGYATDIITHDSVKFIREHREQPFFLFLSYNAPHFGKGWDDKNNQTVNTMQPHPDYLKKASFIEDITRRKYAAKVMQLDDSIGKILSTLEQTQLTDNTLIIFLTDHGGDYNYGGDNQPYRGQKATLFEGGLKVPCVIKWPKKIQSSQFNHSLLSSLDIFPTLCELTSTKYQKTKLDGRDISKVLTKGEEIKQRDLYWKIGQHKQLKRGEWLSYRSNDYKYIKDHENNEFLFNLKKDPYEKNNLIDKEQKVKSELLNKLRQKQLRN